MYAIVPGGCAGVLAIEQVFHGKNFQSILKVGEARGVAVLAAQLAGLEIREYAPALIKKAATGNGNAAKEQVQRMIGRLLDLPAPWIVVLVILPALALVAFLTACYMTRQWLLVFFGRFRGDTQPAVFTWVTEHAVRL